MDSSNQIQVIKSNIENLKLQIDNIEMQNNNGKNMIDNNKIGEQLIALSIQMFNDGIQAFFAGKKCLEFAGLEKFLNQFNDIQEKIGEIVLYCAPGKVH